MVEVDLHGRNQTCGSPCATYRYGSAPTSLVSFRFFDKKEETIFGPSDILSGGVSSWVEFASSQGCEFTHSQEHKESKPSPSPCHESGGGQSPATPASGPGKWLSPRPKVCWVLRALYSSDG